MAHSISARKRVRQNLKNRARNRWRVKAMRDAIKNFVQKVTYGTEAEATEAFQAVSKIVDKSASKGVIHKNQAARRKSRLVKRLKAKVTAGPSSKPAKTAKK